MCDCCRRLKKALWTARAESEVQTGMRNWFGTLTLSPAEHYQIVTRSRRRLARGGTDFDSLSSEAQFSELMIELGSDVTLWLKRVRKESGAPLRYLLVAEAHKSGAPHLHILVHETQAGKPVRYRTLSKQWTQGFVKFNLIDGMKAARYVCKYISKSAMARVRASLHYGQKKAPMSAQEWSETQWIKEKKAPENEEEKSATTDEQVKNKLFHWGISLTDHTGGKNNGDSQRSKAAHCKWRGALSTPDAANATDTEGYGSTVSETCKRQSQGLDPPSAICSPDTAGCKESNQGEGSRRRVAYAGPTDPDVPF